MAADPALLTSATNVLTAAAALGMAAYGFVDATKIGKKGGISNAGFKKITECLKPFVPALSAASSTWRETLHSHWVNGTALELQKAGAKSLIRLGLNPKNAAALAPHGHVEPEPFAAAVTRVFNGVALTPQDLAVLGRFDASVDTVLDAGYERADQKYRNSARVLAGFFAIVLAVIAGYMLSTDRPHFFASLELLRAVLIGAVSVPLAPIAKDLASSLTAAVSALKTVRGGS